jgi:UDP-N-acetyl-D-mannosaminuronic acid dehydrogenase
LPERLSGVKLAELDEASDAADIHVMLVDHDEFRDRAPPQGELIDTRGVW